MHSWLKIMTEKKFNLIKFQNPLKLKNGITLPHKIMPGPMEGVMNPLFCLVLNHFEIFDYWITPFIQISTDAPLQKTLKRKIDIFTNGFKKNNPVIIQLLGSNPQAICDTCKRLEDLEIKGINFNFACPSKQVLKSGNGAAFLGKINEMLEIISLISEQSPTLSLSVKLRSGLDNPTEMNTFLPLLSKMPIDFIMLHYRTANEMYKKIPDRISRLKLAAELSNSIPLIASGDIFSLHDASEIHDKTDCQGIIIARGLFKDPFLPLSLKSTIPSKTADEKQKENLHKFYNKMLEIAKENKNYANKFFFIETAKLFWGTKSPEFQSSVSLFN